MKLTPEDLGKYRLVKVTYDHTLKDLAIIEESMPAADRRLLQTNQRQINLRIRRRNLLVDWFWADAAEIESYESYLRSNEVRHRLVDHTTTYYRNPEKLAALRNEIDTFITIHADTDFILDRIGLIGIENISKLEKEILEKESKV
jgi:hypothetical protein